jgi:membrane dipeptidase
MQRRATPPSYPWIDGHVDLAYIALGGSDVTRLAAPAEPRCVSLPAMRAGRVRLILATIFVERGPGASGKPWGYDGDAPDSAREPALQQLDWYEQLERRGSARIIRTRDDLDAVMRTGDDSPPGLVLLMEGADPIRDASDVAFWHARGVRAIGLTWALGSRWAGGNSTGGPLRDGAEGIIRAMDALGILHDASHLCDESFDGLLSLTQARVIASHSNARALLRAPAPPARPDRHLTDGQMRTIANRGGVIGLNLYGRFLASGREATLDDAVAHVQHVASVAGRATCALGSDFDGGFGPDQVPAGVRGPDQLDAISGALASCGWSATECESFAWRAWHDLLRDALPRT